MAREERPAIAPRWLEPLVLVSCFVALAAWSWGKWTDVHIDFGGELYLAWQIAAGKALYHEMAYRQGPLSPHWNALWFSLFGVSIRTLVVVNLIVLAGIAALTWRIFALASGRVAALATTAVLLAVFAFSQYTPIANYNYITPYHHAQTHGLVLTLAMIALLGTPERSKPMRLVLAGVCLGGVLLTKAELFVPAAGACGVGLALGGGGWRGLGRVLAGALAPPLLAFAGLATAMPAATAFDGVLGNWAHLGPALGDPFYRTGAGLDAPARNLVRALWSSLGLAGFVVVALLCERLAPDRNRRLWAAGIGGLVLLALVVALGSSFWIDLPRALPAALGTVIAFGAWRAWALPRATHCAARILLAMWTVWALLLLAKLGLHPRVHHYGFVLAMPATLLVVALLVSELPRWVRERSGGGEIVRAVAIAGVVAFTAALLGVSDRVYARKHFAVGEGGDRIVSEAPQASPRGAVVAGALERLAKHMESQDTLLVLPEGIALNYWLRKENPSRYSLFLPTELDAFGREAVLADVQAAAPDFVALVHRLPGEFGVGPFGEDPRNGRALVGWVRDRYERFDRIGAEPFGDQGFGIVLLRRVADPGDGERR